MIDEALRNPAQRVVGTKQALRAMKDGKAKLVYLCKDADEFIYRQVEQAADASATPLQVIDSMQELGKHCLIGVKTATAVVLK